MTAEEIIRIQNAKQAIKEAIREKYVEVDDSLPIDAYADLIRQIKVYEKYVWNDSATLRYHNATRLPDMDFTGVSNCTDKFRDMPFLTQIGSIDTSSVTNMANMFSGCSSLAAIPALDTSSVTNMAYMFQGCSSLAAIPALDTSSVTNMTYMFQGCSSLERIELLDMINVAPSTGLNHTYTFGELPSLRYLRMKNLKGSITLAASSLLDRESVLYLFNNMQTVTGQSVKFHPDVKDRITDDDIAIATAKGYSILF